MAERARSKVLLEGELMFPSDYLAAPDLKGADVTVVIESVFKDELTMVGGRKKVKPLLTFVGKKKKLVCNATNAQSIAFMYGNEASAWVGKSITLYPTKTTFGKQTVDCLRIREKVPSAKTGPAPKHEGLRDAMNVNGVPRHDEPDFDSHQQSAEDFVASLNQPEGESSP